MLWLDYLIGMYHWQMDLQSRANKFCVRNLVLDVSFQVFQSVLDGDAYGLNIVHVDDEQVFEVDLLGLQGIRLVGGDLFPGSVKGNIVLQDCNSLDEMQIWKWSASQIIIF